MGSRLTDRDVLLLAFVHFFRFLTLALIEQLVFPREPGRKKGRFTRMKNRLKILCDNGYLQIIPVRLERKSIDLYALDKQGATLLASQRGIRVRDIWRREHAQITVEAHTLMVIEIRANFFLAARRLEGVRRIEKLDLDQIVKSEAKRLLLREGYSWQRVAEKLVYLGCLLRKPFDLVGGPAEWLRLAVEEDWKRPKECAITAADQHFMTIGPTDCDCLRDWVRDVEISKRPQLKTELGELKPDDEWTLVLNDERIRILLEADRRTEPHAVLEKKVRKYCQVFKRVKGSPQASSYEYQRQRTVTQAKVCFVVDAKQDQTLEAVVKTIAKNGGKNMFAVTSLALAKRPDLLLTRPCWRLAGKPKGTFYSLEYTSSSLETLESVMLACGFSEDEVRQRQDRVMSLARTQQRKRTEVDGISPQQGIYVRADEISEAVIREFYQRLGDYSEGSEIKVEEGNSGRRTL